MDRSSRWGTGQWSHQQRSFAPPPAGPGTRHHHQQTQSESEPPKNTPSLDQFLSGITKEREHQTEKVVADDVAQMNTSQRIQHRPMPPGPGALLPGALSPGTLPPGPLPPGFLPSNVQLPGTLQSGIQQPGILPPGALPPGIQQTHTRPPSALQWDSFSNPFPPPGFVSESQGQHEPNQSQNWQSQLSISLHQHNLDHFGEANTSNSDRTASAFPHKSVGSFGQPSSTGQQPHQEQQGVSSFSRERPHLLAPSQSGQYLLGPNPPGTRQPQAHLHGHHRLPGPNQQFSQHYQQEQESDSSDRGLRPHPSEPHPPELHQSRPQSFGHPGKWPHSRPPPSQPGFHSQQNQSGSSFTGPHPSGPHPSGPHPSRMHSDSGPLPRFQTPPPSPQQEHPGWAMGPFSSTRQNQQALPHHHPRQHLEFTGHLLNQGTVREKTQREKDEEWMKDWLMKNKSSQSERAKKNTDKSISVNESRQLVVNLIHTLRQLAEQKDMLSRRINRDESSWQFECRRVNRMKERVETLQSRLFSTEFIDRLKSKFKKNRKKRERIKKWRNQNYQMKQEDEERGKRLHLKIDTKLAKELQTQQESKREAELQEEIDKTLYEVRKKKQEAYQTLDLIKCLKKLRQLRKEAAQAKGVHVPMELDINFEQKLKPLEELTSKQRDLYREEERAMQVMLEEEHEEYKEQEKKKQRRRQEEKAIKEMQSKMKLIFGKDEPVGPDDPKFPFQQFYHQAESNVHALVDIRHQWDQFLVPDADPEGSPIPVCWVLPPAPSSTAWTSVLDA